MPQKPANCICQTEIETSPPACWHLCFHLLPADLFKHAKAQISSAQDGTDVWSWSWSGWWWWWGWGWGWNASHDVNSSQLPAWVMILHCWPERTWGGSTSAVRMRNMPALGWLTAPPHRNGQMWTSVHATRADPKATISYGKCFYVPTTRTHVI